ncbi:MAG: trypsin-like serine peptidase [Usitatibacter sp.]
MIRRILALAAAMLVAAVAHAQQPAVTVEPEVQPQPLVAATPRERLADPARVYHVTLPQAALAVNKSAAAQPAMGVPLQVGFGRGVPELADAAAHLDWQPAAGGARVAAFDVTSTGAASLRVGLRAVVLPAGSRVRFYAPGEGEVFESTAAEIDETVARNVKAGGESDDARTFWSPIVEGPTAVVEIEIPAGASVAEVAVAAPLVSHLVTSSGRNFAMPAAKGTAASCELDVMCYSAWSAESSAEARIVFTDSGSSYLCSGTLLADNVPATQVPFFLTANHCIATQASASSMQSYWFYRSTACNSGTRGASQTLTGGATLLYTSSATDTSLMRLNSQPPGGAVYAGWSVGSIPALGSSIAGIHHPSGDLQKISFGNIASYATCISTGSESFSCRPGSGSSATFFESNWTNGVTEPGSSGSGLFSNNGHYLIGQLYGGTASCGSPGSDFYGRFDIAYNAGLAPYLNGTASGPGSTPSPNPVAPAIVPAFNYSALWWNPEESGWGLSVTQHNASLFASWFVYNTDGNSRWVVMPGGTWTSPTTFVGDLYSTNGPPYTAPFDAASVSTVHVGSATLRFSSADAGVIGYTVAGVQGTKTIARQSFGVPDSTPVASYADLWWNAAESGWGLSINQQYRTLFAVWYTYGAYGQPVWYVMPGGSWSGTTYTGTLYRTTAAPAAFFGDAFDPSTVGATAVGSMSLAFGGASAATMTYTIDGVTGAKAITRQPF